MRVRIPNNYQPRFYQLPFLRAMDSGKKRACCVWHRRSGKTKTLLNFAIKKAIQRVGVYYHSFPQYGQGRKVIWDARDEKTQQSILDLHIPKEIRKNTNNTEMKIELVNGSIYQIIGADNYDALVGANPLGIILDEWAVSPRYPIAWEYFSPILLENGGWAVFPYTPRGRNHGFEIYQMALRNPDWFCQLLTIEQTQVVSQADIQKEREAGRTEDIIQQEYFCSFLASTEDIVIPFALIQSALEREVAFNRSPRLAGCDPARFGDDRTGFIIRQGGQVIHVEGWRNLDTTQTAGKVIDYFRSGFYDVVAIDVIGIGAGVYDMINNAGVPCVAVNVSEAPSNAPERFGRLRDELWWKVREWFQDLTCSISNQLPEKMRNALVADLQDIHYSYNLQSKIIIESKDDMKERLKFSPDLGDALCCTFAPGIEMRVSEADRVPLGYAMNVQTQDYDPLHFGLELKQ